MLEVLKKFAKKTIGSRKGISWMIGQVLTMLYVIRIMYKYEVDMYDTIGLALILVYSLSTLGMITYEKIKIEFKK